MAEYDDGRINFENPDGAVISTGEFTGEIEAGNWEEIADGVRYKTWKFKDVSEEIADGALVEIMPGHRTPVQFVETDHVFTENFQSGKFLVIYLDDLGDLSLYKYDSSIQPGSFSLDVNKNEFMCIYALKENANPSEIIECEQPGFVSAKLSTVDFSKTEIGGKAIPSELRELIENLDKGEESNILEEAMDVNAEM